MRSCFVRRNRLTLSVLTVLALVAGCQDKRVKELKLGITRDSLMSVTAKGTFATDSMPGIYRSDRYVLNGKVLEVLYFDSKDRKASIDTVPLGKLTPLVMYNGKLVAKGWAGWDSVAKANKIPVPKH